MSDRDQNPGVIFELLPGEHIDSVSYSLNYVDILGYTDYLGYSLESVTFSTNKGSVMGPFGQPMDVNTFSLSINNCYLSYINGSMMNYVDSLTLTFSCPQY